MINKWKPVTTGDLSDPHDIAKPPGGSFTSRVHLAIDLLMRVQTNQRAFDNCFEIGDGTAVVLAISREAQHNPLLARRIEGIKSLEPDLPWSAFAAHFAHVRDLEQFAAACRRNLKTISPNQLKLGI